MTIYFLYIFISVLVIVHACKIIHNKIKNIYTKKIYNVVISYISNVLYILYYVL